MFLSHVKEIKSFLRIYKSVLEILSWTSTLGANKKEENHFWARYAPSTSPTTLPQETHRRKRGCSLYRPLKDRHWKNRKEQRGGESRNKSATEAYKSVCKEKQKKVARASETKPLLFLCVKGWRTKWGEREQSRVRTERERERESLAALTREGEEYGRKVGSGRWWQCLSYLVWIAGWHRARQPRRSLIRGRQMMADRRRVMPARGSERERGKKEQSSFVLSTVCG